MKITPKEAEILRDHLEFIMGFCNEDRKDPGFLITKELLRKAEVSMTRDPCVCNGWGCWSCCDSEEEIRGKQGTFG